MKLDDFAKDNKALAQYEDLFDGTEVEVFEITTSYGPSIEKFGCSELLVSEVHKLYFDLETGRFVHEEWSYTMDNETMYIEYGEILTLETIDQPSDEIL